MNKKIIDLVGSLALGTMLLGANVLPVFAQQGEASGSLNANVGAGGLSIEAQASLMVRIKTRANQEIDRRVQALTRLSARIGAMKRLSIEQKSSLQADIKDQLDLMASLKAKIAADSDLPTLRADVQSITKAYRIYLLVIPRAAISAGSDRALTMVNMASSLEAKFQARIEAAQTAGNDMSAALSALANFKAKVADAEVQAQAAANGVINLKPDNGDQAIAEANQRALVAARAKMASARADFQAAHNSAATIIAALKAVRVNAEGSASGSGSVTTNP